MIAIQMKKIPTIFVCVYLLENLEQKRRSIHIWIVNLNIRFFNGIRLLIYSLWLIFENIIKMHCLHCLQIELET